jgi:hypothetical protein
MKEGKNMFESDLMKIKAILCSVFLSEQDLTLPECILRASYAISGEGEETLVEAVNNVASAINNLATAIESKPS